MDMKKVILISFFLGLFPAFLLANPPRNVEATLNKENGKWNIVAEHPVRDSVDHYIKLYTITVDNKEVKTVEFTVQATKEKQIKEVAIPEIKKGSKVEIKATCNKFGSKTLKFTAE